MIPNTAFIFTAVLSLSVLGPCSAFSIHHKKSSTSSSTRRINNRIDFVAQRNSQQRKILNPSALTLYAASPKFTVPSQEESVELGIREWPQTTKTDEAWSEQASEGQTLIRYILQGSGTVTIDSVEKRFNVGLLMEAEGPANLEWKRDAGSDPVIILTPGFENVGLFAGALLGFVALCGALVALS